VDQERKSCFDDTECEITVLEDVPAADHVDLHKEPNHQAKAEHCPHIPCEPMLPDTQYRGHKLADTVHKKQNDTWDKKIVERCPIEHVRRNLQDNPRREDYHQNAAHECAGPHEDLNRTLRNEDDLFHGIDTMIINDSRRTLQETSSGCRKNHSIRPHCLQQSSVAVLLAQSRPKNVMPGVLSNADAWSNWLWPHCAHLMGFPWIWYVLVVCGIAVESNNGLRLPKIAIIDPFAANRWMLML
jgi:hypothetical protein